jgi:hypothetical protein
MRDLGRVGRVAMVALAAAGLGGATATWIGGATAENARGAGEMNLANVFPPQARDPRAALDELLTADVAFSAAAATRDLLAGLGAMFAADVVMPAAGGLASSRDEAIAALRRDSLNATSKAVWTPVRGGVSADGLHGFTFGYMTVTRGDGTRIPLKYLAYWVKGAEGWRVAAYKRARRPEGPVSLAMLDPALPSSLVPPANDRALIDGFRTSLASAEQAFSDEAQVIGLGAAFAKYGSPDAMNLGGPTDTSFVIGNARIGAAVGGPDGSARSPLNWSSDRVIVASSGDLGVSIGYIRRNDPAPGAAASPGIPFFTIWRRADARAPWRYVAE